jgi:DNA-binding MarR family transcriptional regulator
LTCQPPSPKIGDVANERWLDKDEQQAWQSYARMRRTLETHLAWHLQREFGLSASDFEILFSLSQSPTHRMRAFDLGKATQWEKSRTSHHLSRMEKRGLIRRENGDARYPDIVLTEQGLEAFKACAPAHVARVRDLFVDVLGPGRLAVLTEASNDVLDAIHEHQNTSCPPQPRGNC